MKIINSLLFILSLFIITGCNNNKINEYYHLQEDDIHLNIEKDINVTNYKKIEYIDSLDDFSDFLDYVSIVSENDEFIYTNVTDSYKSELIDNLDYNLKWAGQYGSIAHNFIKEFDISRLDDNIIGAKGSIDKYAFKSFEFNNRNLKALSYSYFNNVIKNKNNYKYNLFDLPLYKSNNGFIKVNNSEQLFYALLSNYFPVCEVNSNSEYILKKMVNAINHLIDFNSDDEYSVYLKLYEYITNEFIYDYDSISYKDSTHTDYAAYFMDGIFFDNKAVCDGIVKSLVSIARLCGLEAYHIGAVNKKGGHAYIYVKINGTYYLSCPTSALLRYNHQNYIINYSTYNYFLTSLNTNSKEWNFYSESHKDILNELTNTKSYEYYQNTYYTFSDKSISLEITDYLDLVTLLNEVNKDSKKYKYLLEIEVSGDYSVIKKGYNEFIKNNNKVNIINNGMINDKKVYTFVFNEENI